MGNRAKKVLVVDDTAAMRKLIAETVAILGYRAFAVEDGREAVNRFSIEKFDAVITDYNMPGMNGEELTRWIKQNRPGIPVIFTSAQNVEDFQGVAEAAGADKVLDKSEIVWKLQTILDELIGSPRPFGYVPW